MELEWSCVVPEDFGNAEVGVSLPRVEVYAAEELLLVVFELAHGLRLWREDR